MHRFLLIALLLVNTPGLAVEVQPGELYSAGTQVESSALGIGLTIPQGWRGGWPPGSAAFVLENDEGSATILMVFDEFNQQQIASMMGQNIPLDEGIYLMPDTQPTNQSSHFENHYQVVGSAMSMSAFIAAKSVRQGLSLATIVMAADISPAQQQVAVQLTTELNQFEPKTPEPDPNVASWQDYMKGRYIARYYTGSGYREKQELWLCSDGTFASSFNSGGYSMDGFSGAFGDNNTGRWQAMGSINQAGTLQLNYANGNQSTLQLQLQDNLYLDGQQWLRGDNERCY